MTTIFRNGALTLGFLAVVSLCLGLFSVTSQAASTAAELDRDAAQALERLIENNPAAAGVAEKAQAVLIFPSIIKAGLIFGGAYGEGVLKKTAPLLITTTRCLAPGACRQALRRTATWSF